MLQKLTFRAGTNRENTTYANEGGWWETNKVRFRSGQPEKIGGWVKDAGALSPEISGSTTAIAIPPTGVLWGTVRAMWNWANLAGFNLLSLGSNLKYYIQNGPGGNFFDVTPIRDASSIGGVTFARAYSTLSATISSTDIVIPLTSSTSFPAVGGVVLIGTEKIAYSGVSGSNLIGLTRGYSGTTAATHTSGVAVGGYTITVNDTSHGAQSGDFVTFTAATTLSTLTQNYTASTSTSYLTFSTTIPNGTVVQLFTSGAVPGGLALATNYYVINSTSTTCQLSAATNGSAISITSTGTGTQSLTAGITANVLNAEYQITYIGANAYAITLPGPSTTNDSNTGGGSTVGTYQITTGNDTYTIGVGWGAGGWGGATTGFPSTGWGIAAPAGFGIGQQLRLWSQSNYGENLVYNPRGGALYYWVVNASPVIIDRGQILASTNTNTQAATGGVTSNWWQTDTSCPNVCNFVMVSDASRFVLAFGVNDYPATEGGTAPTLQDPLLVRWSNQEDIKIWWPKDTNQAGSYRLSHGSSIITAMQTRQEILVWTDAALYSMQFLGAPFVWGFQILGDNISIAGPNAVATANNITYWMGLDKFYMYSGRVQTLPSTLREYVYSDINLSQSYQFCAGTNEGYNEVWWQYCSSGSTVVDRYVIFNHEDNVWYYGDWDNINGVSSGRTAWLDSSLRAEPMAVTYGVAGGSTNGLLVYHEIGTDDAIVNPPNPIISWVQSSDFDIGDGHNFGFVHRIIPDVTFDGSMVANPSADFTVRPRTFPGANYGKSNDPLATSAQNYSIQHTYNVQQFTEQVYVRIRGRQMAFRVGSSGLGVQWQLGTPRIDIRPDGRR